MTPELQSSVEWQTSFEHHADERLFQILDGTDDQAADIGVFRGAQSVAGKSGNSLIGEVAFAIVDRPVKLGKPRK